MCNLVSTHFLPYAVSNANPMSENTSTSKMLPCYLLTMTMFFWFISFVLPSGLFSMKLGLFQFGMEFEFSNAWKWTNKLIFVFNHLVLHLFLQHTVPRIMWSWLFYDDKGLPENFYLYLWPCIVQTGCNKYVVDFCDPIGRGEI